MERPRYDLIVAAVGGDEEAMAKIIRYFEPMINEKSCGNEAVRERIVAELRKAILHYDLNDMEKNAAYLRAMEAEYSEQ